MEEPWKKYDLSFILLSDPWKNKDVVEKGKIVLKTRKYKCRPKITASPVDDPVGYQRQYYHLVLKRRKKVPPKIPRKKREKK